MLEGGELYMLPRRSALKVLASGVGVAVTLPIFSNQLLEASAHALYPLRAASPAAPAPYELKFFTQREYELVTALAELIIPADEKSPGARAARVHEFIDLMVSESEDHVKNLWRHALEALDRKAEQQFGRKFLQASANEQVSLLEQLSQNEAQPQTLEERFFSEIKEKTIQGYYTSEVGIHQDLEYKGNTVLLNFEGCTHPEHEG